MTNDSLSIRPASFEDISFIRDIALKTWPVAYGAILNKAQLDYMLDKIYSHEALETQIKDHNYFFLALHNFKAVGFASFSKSEDRIYKLQKLYVLPGSQKTGTGLALLSVVETTAKTMGCDRLQLNVNRNNNAKAFYLKNGFIVTREEDIDIGSGYFMNDFIMEKNLVKY